jgi:hypothetical protein
MRVFHFMWTCLKNMGCQITQQNRFKNQKTLIIQKALEAIPNEYIGSINNLDAYQIMPRFPGEFTYPSLRYSVEGDPKEPPSWSHLMFGRAL